MKKLFPVLLLLVLVDTASRAQTRTFLRIYALTGNKIMKGHFAGTTDSSLLIYKDSGTKAIPFSSIGYIKTKRSLGHNMVISAVVGAVPSAIIGAASGEPPTNDNTFGGILHDAVTFTPGEAAAAGFFVGGIVGAGTGALITAFTKSTTFRINGNLNDWNVQKKILDMLPAGK